MFILKNISKQFKDEYALKDVSMTIGSGLNYIIGSSGSGKTSLLKILSGIDQNYQGEAFYNNQSIKALTAKEKSYLYHHEFGFIWQDFNLLEEKSVIENVMLSQYLDEKQDKRSALKLLQELKMDNLAHQKVSKLSGGQKQRVAIARELMKNPTVLFADEPTSALDEQSAKIIMDILKKIARKRQVIIITHDTTSLDQSAHFYELDKGELIKGGESKEVRADKPAKLKYHQLALMSAFSLATINGRRNSGRLVTCILSLLVASTLLLVTLSGAISNSSTSAYNQLFDTYGEGILDITVAGSFISAKGSNKDKPNTDVNQDITGLYEQYKDDSRVEYIVLNQAFNEIEVILDNQSYSIQKSGNTPTINKITAGRMPMSNGNEVVVPNSFVRQLGISDEEALGKTITFNAAIYNWDTGSPILKEVNSTAEIVGVIDSTVKYEFDGKIYEYTVDDSFFFSKPALDDMRQQANTDGSESNFVIRTKSPADLITIKDELNAKGIVPLGRFELVEDTVRLSNQTTQQSSSAIVVLSILSLVVAVSISMMLALFRKREYAIYKVNGFSNRHLMKLTLAETLLSTVITVALFIVISPLLNMATSSLWGVTILNQSMLIVGMILILIIGLLTGLITTLISTSLKIEKVLISGEK